MKPIGLGAFLLIAFSAFADTSNAPSTPQTVAPAPVATGVDAWLPMTPWESNQVTNETFYTTDAPVTCVFNDHLYLFWRSDGEDQRIYYSYLVTPGKVPDWLAPRHIGDENIAPHAAAACAFNGKLYLFWPSDDSRNSIYFSASADGESWPEGQPVGHGCGSSQAPSACVYHNKLYLFYEANDSSRHIEFTCLDPSAAMPSWSAPQKINDPDTTDRPPAACVYNDRLYVFWSANDSTKWIHYSASSDGKTWPESHALNQNCTTANAPSASVFQNRLYVFWKASDPSNTVYWTNVPPEGNTCPDGQPVNQSSTTTEAPSACAFQDKLCLFWKANDGSDYIWHTQLAEETAVAGH